MATTLAQAWAEFNTARYKAEFYRMWYVGQHAGLTHPQALEAMDDFHRSPTVKEVRRWLLAGTKRRVTLAQLTKQKPGLFVPFEAALLRLGEESGSIEECLRLLGDYFTSEYRMITWLKKKMSYPMFQAFLAAFIAPFSLLFFGHTAEYLLIVGGWLTLLALAGGGILKAAVHWFGQRPKIVLGRLLRALATGTEAGLSLDRVVALAVDAADSDRLKAHVKAQGGVAVGRQPLGKTFEGSGIVPREVIAALNVAEATGDYSSTLNKLAELYDQGFSR